MVSEMARNGSTTVARPGRDSIPLARRLVDNTGGRYSTELGVDVDRGDGEVERWFLAATLFGTRISAAIAERTFRVLDGSGLIRIAQARHIPWEDLVAMLDAGGYTRYDFRTANRLHALSDLVDARYGGVIAEIGRRFPTYPELRAALDALPGWGPVTIELFLRELRGVWPGATPPLDGRAVDAARHIGLLPAHTIDALGAMSAVSGDAGLDVRDLESGLVRLTLAHRGGMDRCPGGSACVALG
jgi:hypothetical protein